MSKHFDGKTEELRAFAVPIPSTSKGFLEQEEEYRDQLTLPGTPKGQILIDTSIKFAWHASSSGSCSYIRRYIFLFFAMMTWRCWWKKKRGLDKSQVESISTRVPGVWTGKSRLQVQNAVQLANSCQFR